LQILLRISKIACAEYLKDMKENKGVDRDEEEDERRRKDVEKIALSN
jgi:hypothetical protein